MFVKKKTLRGAAPLPESAFYDGSREKEKLKNNRKKPVFFQNTGFFMDKYSVTPSAGNSPGGIFGDTDSPPFCVKFAERRTA